MRKIFIVLICLITLAGCQKTTESKKNEYKTKISELLENSFTLSLFAYGNLELEDSVATVDEKTYNLIKNSKIKSLNELNSLLEEVYVPEQYNIFYDELYAKKEFIGIDNKIYVNDNNQSCDIGTDYDFTNFNITKTTDEYIIIQYEEFSSHIFIKDGKLYLDDYIFRCIETE